MHRLATLLLLTLFALPAWAETMLVSASTGKRRQDTAVLSGAGNWHHPDSRGRGDVSEGSVGVDRPSRPGK